MLNKTLSQNDLIEKIFKDTNLKTKTITFQVTEDCCLQCSYCYQGNKTKNKMNFETAKKFIDDIFQNKDNENAFISIHSTCGIIIEFIGGEPLLEVDLIEQIIDYFELKFNEYPDLLWSIHHSYFMTSNGVLYFDKKVQHLLKKYKELLHITITVDGCKESHDMCRVFSNGEGSYDIAFSAAKDALTKFGINETKITLSPNNISYLFDSVTTMITEGFSHISANFIHEEGWTFNDAQICYNELIKIGNWIIENNLYNHCYFSLLDYTQVLPKDEIKNWCGSNNSMIAINYKGELFPCIRFMDSSLNFDQPSFVIGSIENGIGNTEKEKNNLKKLKNLSKNLIFPEECLNCSFDKGCSWCCAYSYQKIGNINEKTTFICDMHKARAVATYDFIKKIDNKLIQKLNIPLEIRQLFRKE